MRASCLAAAAALVLIGCAPGEPSAPLFGEVEDLGGAFGWAEGPVWIERDGGYLLFTDVPNKTIWRYDDQNGLSEWMTPSTLPGADVPDDAQGANGLALLDAKTLLVPDHGSRTLYALDLDSGDARVLADTFGGRRLNSPNDVVRAEDGTLYFTDPPYGLRGQDDDPARELDVNAVYRLSPDGAIDVVSTRHSRPNGIALSPDERSLYVSNSNPDATYWRYAVDQQGRVDGAPKLLADLTEMRADIGYGNPDGLAVARDGTLFATGPGGLVVLSPDGDVLDTLSVGKPCANVTFGGDERDTLYLTCKDRLYRVPTSKRGL